jgi:hypothetical protein
MDGFGKTRPSYLEEVKYMIISSALISILLFAAIFWGYAKATGTSFLQLWVR